MSPTRSLILPALLLASGCSDPTPGPPEPKPIPRARYFEDVTEDRGIRFVHRESRDGRVDYMPETLGPGVASFDHDGDGFEDLFFVQGRGDGGEGPQRSHLYRNGGGSTPFVEIGEVAGIPTSRRGQAVLSADLDSDGYPDLVITTYRDGVRFLQNMGDGTFRDASRSLGSSQQDRWWTSITTLDHDLDGRLDLYVGSYVVYEDEHWVEDPEMVPYEFGDLPVTMVPLPYEPSANLFLHQRPEGGFLDRTADLGLENDSGRTMGVLAADLDDDGWTDLFVANDVSPCALFHNRGGRFEDASTRAWIQESRGSMGIAMSDFDRDGDWDLVVTHWVGDIPALYTSRHSRTNRLMFQDAAVQRGLGVAPRHLVGWGTAFIDLGLDAVDDLVILNGHTSHGQTRGRLAPQAALLFLGQGGGFVMRPQFQGGVEALDAAIVGRGMALTDITNDGHLDLVIGVNNGRGRLWAGVSTPGRWLGVRLVGTASSRDPMGARVEACVGGTRRRLQRVSGDSFFSSHSPRMVMGLGRSPGPESLRVHWPSGRVEDHRVPGIDRYLRLVEGTGSPVAGSTLPCP